MSTQRTGRNRTLVRTAAALLLAAGGIAVTAGTAQASPSGDGAWGIASAQGDDDGAWGIASPHGDDDGTWGVVAP